MIGYEYDDKGELVSISIDGVPFIKNIKTNDNGLLSYEYNDGSKHTRTYDTNGRVTKLSYPNYTEEVDYNVVSNITKIKADTISRTFGYDNLDRLTSYEQNATDFQKFVYDANGNRLNQNQENNLTKLFSYRPNSNILNSIKESNTTDTTNISYEYDATGNIIKDDKHTYTYDSRNRLVAVDSNVTYQYNYDNKRVSKTVNGVKTYFIYDGHKLIGEYKLNLSDNSREEYVYLNSTPIAVITPKGTYRLYADHLDTPRRVATNDEDATVLWKWESKPFGESMADEDVDKDGERFVQNLRFPGQYFDTELKTHYNINRDYNPVIGRYIQSDPVGFDGGVNGYVYANGNSLKNIDTCGLWCCCGFGNTKPKYSSQNILAQGILKKLIPLSVSENVEYAGTIYEKNSKYDFIGPYRGGLDFSDPHISDIPCDTKAVAGYHTHGATTKGYTNEKFSRDDFIYLLNHKIDGYLGTPKGKILFFNYKENKIYEIVD